MSEQIQQLFKKALANRNREEEKEQEENLKEETTNSIEEVNTIN